MAGSGMEQPNKEKRSEPIDVPWTKDMVDRHAVVLKRSSSPETPSFLLSVYAWKNGKGNPTADKPQANVMPQCGKK